MSFIVEFILHKYLDKFFYGIDKKNIEAGILDGRITISNIGLQENIFDNLNFPIKINYSYVQKVQLHIPWRSQQTPVNIYISNIYAIISAKDKNLNVNDIFMKKKEKALRDGIQAYLESLKEEPKNQKEAGVIQNKIKKLLYNINVNIGCIHFRYESQPTKERNDGVSFGLKINNINLCNVNKEGKKQFFNYQKSKEKIIRGLLSIDFIGVYVNSKETKFIFKKNMQSSTLNKSTSLGSKNLFNKNQSKQASKRDYAFLTNEMRHISFPQKLSSTSNIHQELHYIFVISVKTLVSYNLQAKQMSKQPSDGEIVQFSSALSNTAIISFDIDFPSVSLKITQEQFHDIKKIGDFFSSFQAYWTEYVSQKNLVIHKEKNYVDISILLKQRKKKAQLTFKEKFQLKTQCRKYLKWVFLTVFQQRLKRSFLIEALKKDVTLQNLLKNKKISKIIKKINEEKLKNWVMEAMSYRKKFVDATSIFERYSQKKIKQFLNKLLGTFQSIFTKKQDLSLKTQSPKEQLFSQKPYQYEFSMKINLLTLEVSKLEKFGVGILMKNLRSDFLKRNDNFSFEMRIQDLEAHVFSCKNSQKRKTIVPIIRKSIIQSKEVDLLYLKYEKNPMGSLNVNAQYELDFESIEITIYPEAFKQFYSILFSDPEKSKETKQTDTKKKKTVLKKTSSMGEGDQGWNSEYQSPNLLLRNNVKGKIRSPWIIFPLGRNNNPEKQCWVVRLGDFNLQTPQMDSLDVYKQKQNLYEKYTLQLRQFELKYYSSVKFFYSWLKFNQNEQALFSIPYYKEMRIVNMINPFTCSVDFSTLKKGLSSATKSKNFSYLSNIHIEGIEVFLSNFLLEKLKERLDIMGEEENYEDFQFIEQNVDNIYEEHAISGWARVTNDKWREMKFFLVLKGHFIYYFVSENQTKYYFFTDVRKAMIRLVGRQIDKINPQIKNQKVSIFLDDPAMLSEWKKHIAFSLQKKQKKHQDKNDHDPKPPPIKEQKPIHSEKQKNLPRQSESLLSQVSTSNLGKQAQQQHISSSKTKMSVTFIMNRLEIKLRDKQEKEFLLCYFRKSNFTYRCLYNPQAAFSLSSWDVFESYEDKQKEITFLSSKRFNNSDEAKQEKGDWNVNGGESGLSNWRGYNSGNYGVNKERNNFLEVRVEFNSITNELSDIYVDIDKLFIAWKVDLITKILTFFFYSSEMGQAPTPYTVEKRTLGMKFEIKKFYVYAYQGAELVGLIRLQDVTIIYFQSSIEEYFDVKILKLQIDQSVNNSLEKREALLVSKGTENPFKLKYHIRKKNYKKIKEFQTVENLKAQFGPDTIVSLLTCELQDSIVVYEHELTFRMLNYVLNHVFGTIAAKFKKRSYSPKYIYEVLKMQKINTMQVRIKNFTFMLPPHSRTQNHLLAQIEELKITKNLNPGVPELRPHKVTVPTKFEPVNVFYETMCIECMNLLLFQRFGKETPITVNKKAIDLRILMSKVNLVSDYYNVLKHYDDLDRLSVMKIQFMDELALQVPKITFVTLLQIFYQNIKQRDGKAEIFESVLPYPPKKQYIIQFPSIIANLYEFDQKEKAMTVFNKLKLEKFHILYTNYDTKSQMNFSSTSLSSQGEFLVDIWNSKKERMFTFKMMSDTTHSTTKIQLNVRGYQLDFSFNKLNNILEFINYDSDLVANKRMPPKPSSFMCVNVFAQDCMVKLQDLWVTGEFLVTYTKNAKNYFDPEILKYLEVENVELYSNKSIDLKRLQEISRKSIPDTIKDEIADKQIKVDGENIKLSIKGDTIGEISSLYFHREDFSAKRSMKRFKKELVQIGESIMSVQISDMDRIINAYEKRIKKSPEFVLKEFFQPWNSLPNKSSYTQKRRTEVQFARINAFLVPNEKKNPLFYLMFGIKIPLLTYSTLGKDQQITVDLGAAISHHNQFVYPQVVGQIKKIKLVYRSNKDKGNKDIQIGNCNDFNCYLSNLNTQTLYILSHQLSTLSSSNKFSTGPKLRKYLNYNYAKALPLHSFITINNTTSFEITVQIATFPLINVQNFKTYQQKLNFQQLLEMFTDDVALITIHVGNKKNVFNQKLNNIQLNREIQLTEEMIVKFSVQSDAFVVYLFQGCIIKNNTKLDFYIYSAEDKQFKITSGEQKCFLLVDTSNRRMSSNHLNIHRKIEKILVSLLNPSNSGSKELLKDKGEEISLKNSGGEQIFNQLIMVKKVKRNGTLTIQLREKYTLCNFTPFLVFIGHNHRIKYKENCPLSYGLYSEKNSSCSSRSYPITVNNRQIELNLLKFPDFFQVEMTSEVDSSDRSQKMKIEVYTKMMLVRIFAKEVKSDNGQTINIFLFTKTIFQCLTVQKIFVLCNPLPNMPKSSLKDKGFQIDHDEQISFNEDLTFLFLQSAFQSRSEKVEKFNLKQLSSEDDKSKSKQNNKLIYGKSFYLIQQNINLVTASGLGLKEAKQGMTQTKVKICDSWTVANITPFLVKIKGGVQPDSSQKKPDQNMKMQREDQIIQTNESHLQIEINCNQQRSIPYEYLISTKNSKALAPFLEVCFMDLKNSVKFYRQLKISEQNISYIEVGDQICKVTVIVEKKPGQKDQQNNNLNQSNVRSRWLRLILESSDQGYKIENNLEDIVAQVKNGELNRHKDQKHERRSRKLSKDMSYISDAYSVEEELKLSNENNQILIQPSNSKNLGIKAFSPQGHKMLTLSFYYPLRNIDFKQSVLLELDNLAALGKKQLFLTDASKKSSFTVLVLTEMLKENKFHIKLYKKSLYEESIPQVLKLTLKQFRLSLYLGQYKNKAQFEEEKIKLELCNLYVSRQKHIDVQNFDVKLEKILLIEGNTQPIIAALDKRKQFLNLQAILQKAPHGFKGKYISIKLTPFEINGRQGIILRLLQKIAKIRSYKTKGTKLQSLMPRKNIRLSMQRERIVNLQFTIPEPNIEKEWQALKKGSKPISLDLLEVMATSIFLSYTKSQQMLQNSPFLSDPILKYFLLLPSIGQTKLPIPDFEIKNFHGATKELLKLIAKQLKSTIGQSILYSLTSLSIFDNPIQAVDDLVRYMMTILQTI